MTKGEKMVWAAVYAIDWNYMYQHQSYRMTDEDVTVCVENAWAAVKGLRGALPIVQKGWGDDDENTLMLKEMLESEVPGK